MARSESGSSESVVALRPTAANIGRRSSSSGGGRARPRTAGGSWTIRASTRRSRAGRRRPTGDPRRRAPPAPRRPAARRRAARRKEILPVRCRALCETEEVGEARLEPAALVRIGDVLGDRGAELGERGLRCLFLDDPGAHPHHLRERPVGDAVAVGEAAAPVPPEVVGETVHVLLELPGDPGLADPRDADDRDQLGLALLRRRVEEFLDQPHLALAPDERRLEADGLLHTAAVGRDAERAVEGDRLALSLQLVLARRLVRDRRLGRPSRRLADEDAARLGRGLDPRGGADEVAGTMP
jgi:hypothetical protein